MVPFDAAIRNCRRVLLAGAGGGYDVLGAVPLAEELLLEGKEVHLASLTFTARDQLRTCRQVPDVSCLYSVGPDAAREDAYCPEAWLSSWYRERGRPMDIWCLEKVGVRPLRQAYQHLSAELALDAIVLLDGGIDALLRGDETSLGTPGEDLVSLSAVASTEGPKSYLACVGLGAELRDGISHAQALERVAALTRSGHFMGAKSLVAGTVAGEAYLSAVNYVVTQQASVRRSHVQGVIKAAVEGSFGCVAKDTWVSPLSSLFWFFSLPGVAEANLFLPQLAETETIWQVNAVIDGLRKATVIREPEAIPL